MEFNKGAELDKQIYKEGEPTWGLKEGFLDVEDVKEALNKFMSEINSYEDLTPINAEYELEKIMGDKLFQSN